MPSEEFDVIQIELRDPDNQLVKMIDYIMGVANIGHSFEVVVDPDMKDYRKSFFMDGDGPFYINKVMLNSVKVEVKDDKLQENEATKTLRRFFKTVQ